MHSVDLLVRSDVANQDDRTDALFSTLQGKVILHDSGGDRLTSPGAFERYFGRVHFVRIMPALLDDPRKVVAKDVAAALAYQVALSHAEHRRHRRVDMSDDPVDVADEQSVGHMVDYSREIGKGVLQLDNRVLECKLVALEDLRKLQCHGLHGVGQQPDLVFRLDFYPGAEIVLRKLPRIFRQFVERL